MNGLEREYRTPDVSEMEPEYWDGHDTQDSCRPQERPDLALITLAASSYSTEYGRMILNNFHSSPRALARSFQDGEVIKAASLEQGSVLRFRYESVLVSDLLPAGSYTAGDYWGVVCETGIGRPKAIYIYRKTSDGDIVVGNPHPETEIKSDSAVHRVSLRGIHKFERYSGVTSFTTGRGKKLRIPFSIPRLEIGSTKPLGEPV